MNTNTAQRSYKYETIAITATPDEGYVFESYSLNDDIPVNASSFEMPGIYTKLRVNFAKKGGVACTQADEVLIEAKEGAIEIHYRQCHGLRLPVPTASKSQTQQSTARHESKCNPATTS